MILGGLFKSLDERAPDAATPLGHVDVDTETCLVGVVEQERPQHGIANDPAAVVRSEQLPSLTAVVRAEGAEELRKLPERRVRSTMEFGTTVEVIEVPHQRVIEQRPVVKRPDVHDGGQYGDGAT